MNDVALPAKRMRDESNIVPHKFIMFRTTKSRAAAFFIFFTRTAWTQIVASDFRFRAAHGFNLPVFFTSRRRILIRSREHELRRATRRALAFDDFGCLFGDDLKVEQRAQRVRVNPVKHRPEQIETFFLVFNERVFLTISN